MIPERYPPYAPEAEISVLGGMLIDTEAPSIAFELLKDEMFFDEKHRKIFSTMKRLFDRGEPIESITTSEEMKKAEDLHLVGGLAYFAELLDAVPTAANIAYHAKIVRERWQLRRLISAGTDIVRMGHEPGEKSIGEILDAAGSKIFDVVTDQHRDSLVHIKQAMQLSMVQVEEMQSRDGKLGGVPTGYLDLDEMTGGWQKSDLIIVAARPSMGKTALVTGSALAACEAGTGVAIFSLEMSKEQIVQRMLCSHALVDLQRLLRGRLRDDDYVRLAQAGTFLNTAPIWIDDSSALSVTEIRAKAKRLKAEQEDLGLIVVDYIQLMTADAENRTQEVSKISRGLKALAKELRVPVLALSQLSRANEARSDKRPQLSDLRESGSIEQDADIVAFIYRPEKYMTPADVSKAGIKGKAELIVGKQRNGPTGTVDLFFREECARFESTANWGVVAA
jgi:replicative DNA helicase